MRWIKSRSSSICLIISLSLCVARSAFGESPAREVIATVDGQDIYLDEVKPLVAMKLYQLEVDRYTLLKSQIDELVTQRLLHEEAERRGISVDQLLTAEVTKKVPPFDDAIVQEYLAQHPEEAEKIEQDGERRARLAKWLDERRVYERRLEYFESLKAAHDVSINLEPPVLPKQDIDLTFAPIRGAADAKVTIVHFASFRCSLCAESAEELQRLMADFPGQIRWAHVTYFNTIDELALEAAELAHFAQEQGRFWALHDRLFAEHGKFTAEDLPRLAEEVGLDPAAFDEARKDARYLPMVKRDIDTAQASGVRRTPTLFINGRHFSPTFGYEDLHAIVESELAAATDAAGS